MIRLRIERYPENSGHYNPFDETMVEGLTWYENGTPVGRVIIEQEEVAGTKIHPKYGEITAYKWVPVEVIDDV